MASSQSPVEGTQIRYPVSGIQPFPELGTGYRVQVTGNWPLATGNWVLVTGYWPLETGHWPLGTGYRVPGTGHWKLATELRGRYR